MNTNKQHTRKNLTNVKFGKLTAKRIVGYKNSKSYPYGLAIWECVCDCGKVITRQCRSLDRDRTKHCGCSRAESLRKKPKESGYNDLYCQYRIRAKKKNIEFNLNKKKFIELITSNCVYCGIKPNTTYIKPRSLNISEDWRNQSTIYKNGIDRVDNTIGYTEDNSVTCCKTCNNMKHALTLNEFKLHVKRIYEHLRSTNE